MYEQCWYDVEQNLLTLCLGLVSNSGVRGKHILKTTKNTLIEVKLNIRSKIGYMLCETKFLVNSVIFDSILQ